MSAIMMTTAEDDEDDDEDDGSGSEFINVFKKIKKFKSAVTAVLRDSGPPTTPEIVVSTFQNVFNRLSSTVAKVFTPLAPTDDSRRAGKSEANLAELRARDDGLVTLLEADQDLVKSKIAAWATLAHSVAGANARQEAERDLVNFKKVARHSDARVAAAEADPDDELKGIEQLTRVVKELMHSSEEDEVLDHKAAGQNAANMKTRQAQEDLVTTSLEANKAEEDASEAEDETSEEFKVELTIDSSFVTVKGQLWIAMAKNIGLEPNAPSPNGLTIDAQSPNDWRLHEGLKYAAGQSDLSVADLWELGPDFLCIERSWPLQNRCWIESDSVLQNKQIRPSEGADELLCQTNESEIKTSVVTCHSVELAWLSAIENHQDLTVLREDVAAIPRRECKGQGAISA
jgi:hypothetical protein